MPSGPVADLPAALRVMVEDLDTTETWQLTDDALLQRFIDLHTLINQLHAHAGDVLAEIEHCGAALRAGARTTQTWISGAIRVSPGEAKKALLNATVGRVGLDPAHPEGEVPFGLVALRKDWAAGVVNGDHVAVTRTCLTHLTDAGATPAVLKRAEDRLTEEARVFDPATLAKLGKQIRLRATPTDTGRAEDPATRTLTLAQTFGGVAVLNGELDAEGYTIVQTALNAFTADDTPGDASEHPRTPAQRRGDALVRMAHTAMSATTTQGAPTTVVVTIPFTDLQDAVGSGATEWGHPLSAEAVRRIACDAGILPVVLGSNSVPLDVGRARYPASAAQKAALAVRDEGCVFPHCDRPPAHTEAHHIEHWVNGGRTDLGNLVLLCSRHHHDIHARGWAVDLDETGTGYVRPPAWLDPAQQPRYHHRFRDRRQRNPDGPVLKPDQPDEET